MEREDFCGLLREHKLYKVPLLCGKPGKNNKIIGINVLYQ
jgi:hypothetical protein